LGLGEAKAVVDGAPQAVIEGANKEAADKAKAALEEAGATVTLNKTRCSQPLRPPPRRRGPSSCPERCADGGYLVPPICA
ncbi:ribosomal protein L7/L12, partial [Salmonella enterica]|uniref:ribosomal protein L7/L12 n=1 Tax=Salmonella enterica TaxID=28901 RepID=UPI003F7A919A